MIQRFFFRKEERLNRKIIIQRLFDEGKIIKVFPLRIIVLQHTEQVDSPVQILISVPKKTFKNAVQRNLLKRRIREAYRLNKHEMYKILVKQNIQIAIGVVYVGDNLSDFGLIEKKIKQAFIKINTILSEKALG